MGRSKYPSPKTSSSENGASALSNCHFASVPGTWWYAFSNCHSNGSSGSEIRTPRMLFPYMLHCTISSTSCLTQQLAKNFAPRSEEHTSELQSLMRISSAVFCLQKQKIKPNIL